MSMRHVTALEETLFRPGEAEEALKEHFGVATLEAYGCQEMPLATGAAGGYNRLRPQDSEGRSGASAGASHLLAQGVYAA